jgi:Gpi18-like mannosyltransferase
LSTQTAAAAPGEPDRGWITLAGIAAAALGFRCLSAVVAFISRVSFPSADPIADGNSVFGGKRAFWDIFARWDSGWYFQIAYGGYHYTPEGRDTIGFFPAYPLLMRYVGRLLGRSQADLYYGGIIVSWTAFVLAMIGLYKLARLDVDAASARRAVLLTMVFPFAYFFGIVYTEALFLAATVGAFYFFRTRRWLIGGLCGALATATRVNGIIMWPALAWIAWRLAAKASTRERLTAAAGLLLVPAGIGLYSLYVWQLSGHPFAWKTTIELWGYYPGGNALTAIVHLLRDLITRPIVFIATVPGSRFDALNGLAALTFVIAIPFVWIRFGAAYGLYMAANLWLPLSSGLFEGLGRYCSVLFPFFILIGSLRSRTAITTALVASSLLYTLCMSIFTNLQPLY